MEEERLKSIIDILPPEILQRIVFHIPLKEAVRASILSTAWRNLCTPIRLEFYFDSNQTTGDDEADTKTNQIVNLLLKSCGYPELWKFRLGGFHDNKKEDGDLIFSAAKGPGKELHLDFSGGEKQTNQTIMADFNLISEPSGASCCESFPADQMANFSSLRTLHLISVNRLAGDLVSTLFFSCPLLESLKLEKCTGIQHINVKASNSLKAFAMADCPNTASIAISSPNLESFRFRGALPLIQLKSCPRLVDVTLDLRNGFENNEFDCENGLDLLASLKDIEILTISGWFLEWLCECGVIFERLRFQFNKLKQLCWLDSSMNKTKRDSLACFLNISPFLEKLFIKVDHERILCPHFHKYWNKAYLWINDYEIEESIASQHQHFKMVQVMGFTIQEDQLLLMDLLLKKSGTTLDSMTVIISSENRSRRVSKIPMTQLQHTSSSDVNRILVPSPNEEDHFYALTEKEEVDDKHFLRVWSML
ncbi:hypothetical protein U1Q18_008421 [Sarracenia purpurea var. burkii]